MGFVDRLTALLLDLASRLEVFYPKYLEFLISRKLGEYEEAGRIEGYEVRSRRLGRYHYLWEVELYVKTR